MNRAFILSLLVLQSVLLFGQDAKTKKKKANEQEGTATFYVLASDDTTKHGEYQIKAYSGNRILLKGNYSNDKKVGLWEEQYYGKEYKGPKASGYYENDIKAGNWTYFNYGGDTNLIYDWTNSRVVFSKMCGTDTKEYPVIEDGKEYRFNLDCPPTCVTGRDYFLYEFSRDIGEHADLFRKTSDGLNQLKTKISVTIDKSSNITDISYSTEERSELTEIINRYIRSYKWIPGKKSEKNVTSKFEFAVNLSAQF